MSPTSAKRTTLIRFARITAATTKMQIAVKPGMLNIGFDTSSWVVSIDPGCASGNYFQRLRFKAPTVIE